MSKLFLALMAWSWLVLTVGQIVGTAYFASFIQDELRPYFEENGMDSDTTDAKQAFVFLITSAVCAAIAFLDHIFKIFASVFGSHENSRATPEDDFCCMYCTNIVSMAIIITMVFFACLTTSHAWNWWGYFAAEGLEHLAANCHGLAAMMITCLVLSTCLSIVIPVVIAMKRTFYLGQE